MDLEVRRFNLPRNGITHKTARQVKGVNDAMETCLYIRNGVQYLIGVVHSWRDAFDASTERGTVFGDHRRSGRV